MQRSRKDGFCGLKIHFNFWKRIGEFRVRPHYENVMLKPLSSWTSLGVWPSFTLKLQLHYKIYEISTLV